jgi:hypothetical protein
MGAIYNHNERPAERISSLKTGGGKMAKNYARAEQVMDTERCTTEFYMETPDGRMSVRMPNFLSNAEQQRRMKVIEEALNAEHAGRSVEKKQLVYASPFHTTHWGVSDILDPKGKRA